MPSTSKPHISPSFDLKKKSSNITDRLHDAANARTSGTKQVSRTKDKSGAVQHLDQFMQDNTDPEILEQGRQDEQGNYATRTLLPCMDIFFLLTWVVDRAGGRKVAD